MEDKMIFSKIRKIKTYEEKFKAFDSKPISKYLMKEF